jgi:hypothetical protein
VVIPYQLRDADGQTSVSPGQLTINFDDDMPSINGTPTSVTLTSGLSSTPGSFAFAIGADNALGPNLQNYLSTTVTGSVSGQPITITSQPTYVSTSGGILRYDFDFTYDADPGAAVDTQANGGSIFFNPADGTYQVTLDQAIRSFSTSQTSSVLDRQGYNLEGTPQQSEIVVSQLTSPTPLFVQFTGDAATSANRLSAGGNNALVAGETITGPQTFVSISNTENGVSGDTIQGGEVLDFNFFNFNPGGTITSSTKDNQVEATGLTFRLDGVGGTEDFVVILKLYDTSTGLYTTRAVIVGAEDVYRNDDVIPAGYSPGANFDNNDGFVIIEANDYQLGNENLRIVGAQLLSSTENITGSGISLNAGTGVTGGSSTTQLFGSVDNATTDETVDQDVVKISDIGIVRRVETPQSLSLDFTVSLTDSDGDTVSTVLQVNPAQPATARTQEVASFEVSDSSLLGSDSGSNGERNLRTSASNTNLALLAGLAAGFATMPAAASTTDEASLVQSQSADDSDKQEPSRELLDSDVGASKRDNGGIVDDASAATSSIHGEAQQRFGGDKEHAIEAEADASGTAPVSALDQGTEASGDTAAAAALFGGGEIHLPDTAQIAHMAAQGAKGGAGKVGDALGSILADALAGGGLDSGDIDQLINAAVTLAEPIQRHQSEGEVAADLGGENNPAAIASPLSHAVSGWDAGDSSPLFMAAPAAMESKGLHPDAIQPVANG